MALISRLSSLWRNLLHRDRFERDLDDEVRTVFGLLVDEKIESGMRPDDARRAAMLELGGVESVKAQVRDVSAGAVIETLQQDIRYAARSLRLTPGFTATVVITLALGIGANTAIFTLLDAVILKPLPVPAAHELVTLYERAPVGLPDAAGGTGQFLSFSFPRFRRLERALDGRGSLAAMTRSSRFVARLPGRAQASPVRGQLVSGGYFATLGVAAAHGRVLSAGDVDTAQPVGVISDGFWKRSFAASGSALGQTLMINDVGVTVVGVAPPGFVGVWTDADPDVWLPLTLQPVLQYQSNVSSYANADRSAPWPDQDNIAWLGVFGRVAARDVSGVSALLQAANHQGVADLAERFGDAPSRSEMLAHTLVVEPLARGYSGLRRRFSDGLFALMAMVAIVLLVTCANVANLLLTRGAGRARDMAIRIALGATTGRLLRQSLTEGVMLAGLGGAAGLLAGEWASGLIARQVFGGSGELPPVFSPDARVMFFTAGVTLTAAIVLGLAPALRAVRAARVAGLATNRRGVHGASTMKGMRPLVAGQVALAVIVVFAAVLLGRTLINFTRLDPGFATDHLLSTSFDIVASGYSRDQLPALGQRLVAAVQAVPGVTSAAVSSCGLVVNCSVTSRIRMEGASGEPVSLHENWVGRGYFEIVGVPVVGGRAFDERDTARSPRVAMITESLARRYFPGQNPIGRRLGFRQLDTEIVGVVRDVRSMTLRDLPVPMVYFPIDQPPVFRSYLNNLDVRVAGDEAQVPLAVQDAIARAEPRLIVDGVAPMSVRLARDVSRERIVAWLASGFAILALFLASLGLYGVLSYAVAGRTQEIGIRMALGARSGDVAGEVVGDGLKVVAAGGLAGVVGAFGTGRLLTTLLFDVSVWDPVTYACILAALTAVTVTAAYVPARRAAHVDPILALRSE